jgi:hypothetical protein
MMTTAAYQVGRQPVIEGKHFSLSNPTLSFVEQRIYDLYVTAAAEGRPAPSIDDLSRAIDAQGAATIPGITRRLEEKGYITRQIYQRGRMVCITATGQCTLPPNDQTPHWRFRTDRVPSPAIQTVRQRAKPIAAMIEAEARLLGKSLSDFLSDLVYIGWHEYVDGKEEQ